MGQPNFNSGSFCHCGTQAWTYICFGLTTTKEVSPTRSPLAQERLLVGLPWLEQSTTTGGTRH